MTGITNPAQVNPGNVHGLIRTSGMTIVNKYMRMTLINQENNPNVRIFIGIKRILRRGLMNIISSESVRPARSTVCHDPKMRNDGTN